MIDVTDVPGAPVSVDDEFTLIGTQGEETIDAIEMAQWGNTISYEIVTAMSGRLPGCTMPQPGPSRCAPSPAISNGVEERSAGRTPGE